jgi:hypothetical protein
MGRLKLRLLSQWVPDGNDEEEDEEPSELSQFVRSLLKQDPCDWVVSHTMGLFHALAAITGMFLIVKLVKRWADHRK